MNESRELKNAEQLEELLLLTEEIQEELGKRKIASTCSKSSDVR